MTCPDQPGCCDPPTDCDICGPAFTDAPDYWSVGVWSKDYYAGMMYHVPDSQATPPACDFVSSTTFSDTCLGISTLVGIPDPRVEGICHRLLNQIYNLARTSGCVWQAIDSVNCETCSFPPKTDTAYIEVTLDADSDITYVLLTIDIQFRDWCQENTGGPTGTNERALTTYRLAKADFKCACPQCFEYVDTVLYSYGGGDVHNPTNGSGDPICPPCSGWPDKITVYPIGLHLVDPVNFDWNGCNSPDYGYGQGLGCPQCCDDCFDVNTPAMELESCVGGDPIALAPTTINLGYRQRGRTCVWTSYETYDDHITTAILTYSMDNPTTATLDIRVANDDGDYIAFGSYTCATFACGQDNTFTIDHNPGGSAVTGWESPCGSSATGGPFPETLLLEFGADCTGGAVPKCSGKCLYKTESTDEGATWHWVFQEAGDPPCECNCVPPEGDVPQHLVINAEGICTGCRNWCEFEGIDIGGGTLAWSSTGRVLVEPGASPEVEAPCSPGCKCPTNAQFNAAGSAPGFVGQKAYIQCGNY